MKKKLLTVVLVCVTLFSLVACGNSASTNDTAGTNKNDTTAGTTEEESEINTEKENVDSNNDWRDMTVVINGLTVTFPCEYGEIYNSGMILPVTGSGKVCVDFLSPNTHGIGRDNMAIPDKNNVIDMSIINANKLELYFPKDINDYMESYLCAVDFTIDVATARAIGNGEDIDGPMIELPNGLKVGDYVDYSKIVETYGTPTEENTTGQDYEYGTEYVYKNEDGTKVFKVYMASNRIIGFHMWVDVKGYDWYNH